MPRLELIKHHASEMQRKIDDALQEVNGLIEYLQSPKFQGPENDYVHIRTDLWNRLMHIRWTLMRP